MCVWILLLWLEKVLLCFQRHSYYRCVDGSNYIKIMWSPVSFLGIYFCSASLLEFHKNTISLLEFLQVSCQRDGGDGTLVSTVIM